jgi:cell division protein FtsZ
VRGFAAPEAFVKYGTVFDDSMGDSIRITVVATGLGMGKQAVARQQPVMQVVMGTGTHGAAVPAGGSGNVDYSGLDMPAVIRRPRSTVEAMTANGVETYDIPAFLRKQAD